MELNLNPLELQSYECSKCKGVFFETVNVIKLIPAFKMGNPQPVQHLLPIPRCCQCGCIQNHEAFLNKHVQPSLIVDR